MSDIFNPPVGTLRTVFLYVGQGDSTLMMIPDGDNHKYVLIDSNKDEENDSINVAEMLKNNIPDGELIFINTHPHKDHLKGIDEIHRIINIGEIWHSGHLPHKDNRSEYDKMQKIISDIGKDREFFIKGSDEMNKIHIDSGEDSGIIKKIGDVDFQVFAPAQYVSDDIEDETAKQRRNRIHEQSGVIKFTYKEKSLLITGDSNKKAWVEHITPHHGDLLKAEILSAPHHGSNSFFRNGKDDKDSYKKHLDKISPDYLIISAPPKGKDSQFDHPHNDAMKIYREYIPEEGIFYLGEKGKSLITDIDSNGNINTEWINLSEDDDSEKQDKSSGFYPYKPKERSNIKPYCAYENN